MTESGPDFWDLSCGNMCDISVEMEKKKAEISLNTHANPTLTSCG